MGERNYNDDTLVDKFALDREYELHPSTYMHWAEKAVEAHAERLKVEEKLKLVKAETKKDLEETRAEVDADVRKYPEKYDLDPKLKETAVAGAVVQSKKYKDADFGCVNRVKEATDKWIEAVGNEQILDEARRAMAYKKTSIEGLERLVLRDYYPRFSKEVKEPLEKEGREKAQDALKDKMDTRRNRRKRYNS